ncbi:ATP-binding protein, partial [Lactobacillus reuteri]
MASKTGVSIPIVVSGNILSEVSEKIPTDIVALNELIKNAYDAKAKSISIQIEQSSNRIVIKDDGHGMDLDGIHKLFHVSISDKNYGSTFSVDGHERLIQGSK